MNRICLLSTFSFREFLVEFFAKRGGCFWPRDSAHLPPLHTLSPLSREHTTLLLCFQSIHRERKSTNSQLFMADEKSEKQQQQPNARRKKWKEKMRNEKEEKYKREPKEVCTRNTSAIRMENICLYVKLL